MIRLLPALLPVLALPAAAQDVQFNRDIRPILSNKCFSCHGPDGKKREADLRLDLRDGALADLGGYAAIVPGHPDQSELLSRVAPEDPDEVMPPPKSKKEQLSPDEVALLRRWIARGAPYQGHWAFEPLADARPPGDGTVNPVDSFLNAALQRAAITPSPPADRATLIRRLALDLTGLLPTLAEQESFFNDQRPDAWERLVDHFLASPHYGERWGRHWLDQARYADSDGYAIDGNRDMWPFRDWVIKALNEDLPFDRFTIEQLAGDLLPNPTTAQLAATAFHRNTLINQEGGSDPEQFRVESVIDRVNTTGAVWLGLTVGCAQCHTHKFDPITQREYYQLFAFFNNTEDANSANPTIAVAEHELLTDHSAPSPAPADRTGKLLIMRDRNEPRPTFVLTRGDFTRPDREAGDLAPGVLSAVPPALTPTDHRPNRLDLAKWIVDPANPLTPRVTVNRIWMRYFGRGLVETEEDFGTQGSLPTHPDLLDFLSRRFIDDGWSMKKLHRLIATSDAYRRSSHARPDLAPADPRNLLLAHQNRIRLDAEIIRDASLAASGLLAPRLGGPSVFPPQPEGIYAFTQNRKDWRTSTGPDRYRRGMYTFFYRSAPYPLLSTFDAPDFQTTCTRRVRSNTPLQALTIANDPAFLEIAQGFAARLIREVPAGLEARIHHAFGLALCRPPDPTELRLLLDYARAESADFAQDPEAARALLTSELSATGEPPEQAAALVGVTRAILNTDNFLTRE